MGSRGHSICAVVLPEKTQKQRRNWKPSSQGSNQHFSNRRCRYPKQELNLMHHKIFQMISHLSDENEGQRDEPLFQSHRLFTAESTNGSSIPGSKSPSSLILQSLVCAIIELYLCSSKLLQISLKNPLTTYMINTGRTMPSFTEGNEKSTNGMPEITRLNSR